MGADRLKGVLAPVVTPFKADLSPDPDRLIAHCQWLLSQNCGLAVFGTNSEANSLSFDERAMLLDELVAAGVDPARMMPGTGCCSITETVRLTAQAVKHGCAGVLMLPPFYYKNVSEDGLFRYFNEVVQRVGDARLRIYLYHIPPVAVVGITIGLVERLLAAYPNSIAGMKDSSGDWNNTKMFLDSFVRTGRAVSTAGAARTFDIFVGSEAFLLANMRHGGVGTISATANVNPAAIHSLFADARGEARSREHGAKSQTSGNGEQSKRPTSNAQRSTPNEGGQTQRKTDDPPSREATARLDLEGLQAKLNVVREIFAKYPMIAALKQAIAIYRNDPGWARVRSPLLELTAEQAKALADQLRAVGFTMP